MTESGHCLSHCLLNGQWKDNATTPSTVLDISDMRRSDLSSSMSVDFFFFFFFPDKKIPIPKDSYEAERDNFGPQLNSKQADMTLGMFSQGERVRIVTLEGKHL
jgi:hypothetical protein